MRNLFFSLAFVVMLGACGSNGTNETAEVTTAELTPAELCAAMPQGRERVACFQDLYYAERAALPSEQRPAGVQLLGTDHTSTRGEPCLPAEAPICFEWAPHNYDRAKIEAILEFIGERSVGLQPQAPQGFVWSHGANFPPSGSNPLPEGGNIYWWPNRDPS